MIIRGTTPTIEYELPFDTSVLSEVFVTISQSGNVIIEKEIGDCVLTDCLLTVKLSQDETLSLSASRIAEIQVRMKTVDGDVLASDIYTDDVYKILKDGVI